MNPLGQGVAAEALEEMARQRRLKAEGRFPHTCADPELSAAEKLTVLVEEVGEVARAMLEAGGLANDKHGAELRKELIQVAAVALSWVVGLDATPTSAEFGPCVECGDLTRHRGTTSWLCRRCPPREAT